MCIDIEDIECAVLIEVEVKVSVCHLDYALSVVGMLLIIYI